MMIAKQLELEQRSQPSDAVDTKRPGRNRTARRLTPRTFGLLASLIAMGVLCAPALAANAGETDVSFGLLGEVRQDVFGGWDDFGSAAAIQGDGKIVVAGKWGFAGQPGSAKGYFALLRFKANGSLDTSFGAGGRVATSFTGNSSSAAAVAIQGDGRIVAAGTDHDGANFAVARYLSDGSPDSSFSGDGKLTTGIGGNERAEAVAIQGDGKIVVAGTTTYPDSDNFFLARYRSDGSLDTSFDHDGKLVTGIGAEERAYGVAIQGNGRIVVAGHRYECDCGIFGSGPNTDFALARYNPSDGSLDTSFDGDGKLTTGIGANEGANSVAIQKSDGRIVAAGTRNGDSFALVRYNPSDGSLDKSFDGDGKVVTALRPNSYGNAVAIQADGRIVVAGESYFADGLGYDFVLTRYNPSNGSLDTSFGGDGQVRTNIGFYDSAAAVAIQADGKIVAAGTGGQYTEDSADFALVRYHGVSGSAAPATSIDSAP